ncbi:beta-hexosaminidase subunit beta-like [Amblyomma americanum]
MLSLLGLLVVGSLWVLTLDFPESEFVRRTRARYPGEEPLAPSPALWPAPQSVELSDSALRVLNRKAFELISAGADDECDVLEKALQRYRRLLFATSAPEEVGEVAGPQLTLLYRLAVRVKHGQQCRYPQAGSDESYTLKIPDQGDGVLASETVWGALRGLETFSQLVHLDPITQYHVVPAGVVKDFPRFSYRGVLLDTARHFLPVSVIKQNLDAMAYNKMNVFHWHIVDYQSWPLDVVSVPNMTMAAYSPRHVYHPEDVEDVIEYARLRGVRVVPEVPSPEHAWAMGRAFPELLTLCYGSKKRGEPFLTPCRVLDPSREGTFAFMRSVLEGIAGLFKDTHLHLGMDGFHSQCWNDSKRIAKFMKAQGTPSLEGLERLYIKKIVNIVRSLGVKPIIWEDPIDKGLKLPTSGTLVMVRKSRRSSEAGRSWQNYVASITSRRYQVVLASCWQLDHAASWKRYYDCDPHNFTSSSRQRRLVVGGEACMWGEFVDRTNLMANLWPNAAVVAERLWSSSQMRNHAKVAPRLNAHRCRLLRRGIPAKPLNSMPCEDGEELDFNEVFHIE